MDIIVDSKFYLWIENKQETTDLEFRMSKYAASSLSSIKVV